MDAVLIIPRDPFPRASVLSLLDTYTSCSSPPPLPPAFSASSLHHLLPVRVPNEAQWECSPASSPKTSSLPSIPKELGWLGSLFLVPCGLAAPALMHHSHERAYMCISERMRGGGLTNKHTLKNGCKCIRTHHKLQIPAANFCELISFLHGAEIMWLPTGQERSAV